MEWNSKLKRLGNVFNAIVAVANEIAVGNNRLEQLTTEVKRVADSTAMLDTALGQLGSTINGNSGVGLMDALQTHETIEGIVDQFGNPRPSPHNIVDMMAFMAMQTKFTHEKLDALVDRLGNQFTNEVLSVLKQENADLEVKGREQKTLIEELTKTIKELTDGDR